MLKLNTEQRAAAHYDGPAKHLLILAGAGTGKTRTLIGRTIYLVEKGVPAKNILLLSFTKRAAAELESRLKVEIGAEAHRITSGTFHSFCLKIMRQIPEGFDLKTITILDPDDAKSLLSPLRGEVIENTGNKAIPKVANILKEISFARNSCLDLRKYLFQHTDYDEASIQAIVDIGIKYKQSKRKRKYLDFDDVLERFADTLENRPNLARKLSSVFPYIMVDEFQDNNPLQYRLLKCLGDSALYLVGDERQSIYSFRGANFKTVHNFKDNTPNSEVLKLVKNYRSTQEILDLSNWLLESSPINYGNYLVSARGSGKQPALLDFRFRFEEAAWVAKSIDGKREADQKLSNIMVLVRTAMSAKDVEAAFIERDIPYQFIGGTSLLEAAHVKDVLALCRVTINRFDELAWVRFLKLFEKVGDVTARKVVNEIFKNEPSLPVPMLIDRIIPGRQDILDAYTGVYNARKDPKQALKHACKSLKIHLEAKYDRFEQREQELALLEQMSERFKSLESFIETYILNPITKSEAAKSEEQDKVKIITVHSAKGLEAPVCYCIGVQPGLYPHNRSLGDEEQMEEERRVLYVALTRAQNELYITRSDEQNNTFGIPQYGGDDYYLLNDLPGHLVDQTGNRDIQNDDEAWLGKLDFL